MKGRRVIAFEYKKEDRGYTLQMEDGSPLGEAYEAAASFLKEIVKMINEHSDKMLPKEDTGEVESEKDQSQEES